jgi:glycosyltransferase involved in cell wall biosynthesis
MNFLFLPRYSRNGGSSRYRLLQYVPLFERAGHTVEARPLFDAGYLDQLYRHGKRSLRWMASGYARRVFSAMDVARFDAVICEQEALPFAPAFTESLFQRKNVPYFLDFDDAAHIKYETNSLLQSKISSLIARADGVVVGNEYLRNYASQFTNRVTVIPTVVDLSRYPIRQNSLANSADVRVGWIGTPSTGVFLESLSNVFQTLQSRFPDLRFRFIGATPRLNNPNLNIEFAPWSEETEIELLAECDIGIMPVPDTSFTRGKCGLKLIQYMACWLPAVASPVGANCTIVADEETGFLAGSPEQWFEKLSALIADPALRRRFGEAGRRRIDRQYSRDEGFARWMSVVGRAQESSAPAKSRRAAEPQVSECEGAARRSSS